MYADPRHIRSKRVNLSLNEDEMRAIEAITDEAATQLARQSIERRYVRRKQAAKVVPLRPRA